MVKTLLRRYLEDCRKLKTQVYWTHSFLDILLKLIPLDVNSVIDVGCGKGLIGALLRIYRNPKRLIGIEIYDPYIQFVKKHRLYDEVLKWDLRKIPLPFMNNEFDLVICIEVIEHLKKDEGKQLLAELERIGNFVIISTPQRFYEQPEYDNNPFQQHRSQWNWKEFKTMGYEVIGVGNFMVGNIEIPLLSYALSRITICFPFISSHIIAYKEKFKSNKLIN